MTPDLNALPTASFLVAALVLFIAGFILGRKDGAKFGALEAKVEAFGKEKVSAFENKWAEIRTLYGVVHEHVQKGVEGIRAEAKTLVAEAQAAAEKAKAELEASKAPATAVSTVVVDGSVNALKASGGLLPGPEPATVPADPAAPAPLA